MLKVRVVFGPQDQLAGRKGRLHLDAVGAHRFSYQLLVVGDVDALFAAGEPQLNEGNGDGEMLLGALVDRAKMLGRSQLGEGREQRGIVLGVGLHGRLFWRIKCDIFSRPQPLQVFSEAGSSPASRAASLRFSATFFSDLGIDFAPLRARDQLTADAQRPAEHKSTSLRRDRAATRAV